jgi:hypothetical protein
MNFRGHTHHEIVFRVMLQRDEQRPKITFKLLESSLPKKIREAVENDWRCYISTEELEFDSAFQKAVRKNIPGVYYVVMAAEYLHAAPFHTALAHFLDVQRLAGSFNEDQIFELAEFFAEHVRHNRAAARQEAAKATHTYLPPRRPVLEAKPARPKGPVRRCAFCGKLIPVAELYAHIDGHLNPARLGTFNPVPLPRLPPSPQTEIGPVILPRANRPRSQSRAGHCICCNHVPIPGDFYCYEQAPD